MAKTRRPAARRGNALLEFVLTIPIIIFVSGLTIYMSIAMLTKQQAVVAARHDLWDQANGPWSPMGLDLNGWAPGFGAGTAGMPRGTGEELERLRPEVEPDAVASTGNGLAHDYWQRLWGNLPGRLHVEREKSFETTKLWDFLDRTASWEHYRDTNPWPFSDLDAWRIARSGPLKVIFDAFHDHLQAPVGSFYKPTRDEIIKRWWHGFDVLSYEATGVAPY